MKYFKYLYAKLNDQIYSFKIKSIKNAIDVISNYKHVITSGSQLKHFDGIGDGIVKRIDEILKTGYLSEIKNNTDIDELLSVHGIGKKKAFELIKKNIKTIDDLKKAYKTGKIELSNEILLGLKYHKVFERFIPYDEMKQISQFLTKQLKYIFPNACGLVCGSFRRKKPSSNDIDFLITYPKNIMEKFINSLISKKFIIDSLTSSDVEHKYMGFCKFNNVVRRIDIIFVKPESFYTALLYLTGSGDFNAKMRLIAKNKGYNLNQFHLKKNNKIIKIKSEKHIFDILNMEYLEPNQR